MILFGFVTLRAALIVYETLAETDGMVGPASRRGLARSLCHQIPGPP